MTCTITLGFAHVLVVGVIGAACLLVGMVIGGNSRTPDEDAERTEIDNDQSPRPPSDPGIRLW